MKLHEIVQIRKTADTVIRQCDGAIGFVYTKPTSSPWVNVKYWTVGMSSADVSSFKRKDLKSISPPAALTFDGEPVIVGNSYYHLCEMQAPFIGAGLKLKEIVAEAKKIKIKSLRPTFGFIPRGLYYEFESACKSFAHIGPTQDLFSTNMAVRTHIRQQAKDVIANKKALIARLESELAEF